MANTTAAIMAIPTALDPIRLVGDEDKHATLLFFGETSSLPDDAKQTLVDSVTLAATMLMPFGESIRDVSRLGTDDPPALVAMLSNRNLGTIRGLFMMNPAVNGYLDNTEQFPNFAPHITLAYPTYTEEPILRVLIRQIYGVRFDRLSVWWNDERIDIPLQGSGDAQDSDAVMAQAVSDFLSEHGEDDSDHLEHHGTKGMKWGVTKKRASSSSPAAHGAELAKNVLVDKAYASRSAKIAGMSLLGLGAAAVAPAVLPASAVLAAGGATVLSAKIALASSVATRVAYVHNYTAYAKRAQARKASVAHASMMDKKTVGDVYNELTPDKKKAADTLIADYANSVEFKDDAVVQSGWAAMTPTERSVVLFIASGTELNGAISHAGEDNSDAMKAIVEALDADLTQHGVLGMKWGHHKDRATGGHYVDEPTMTKRSDGRYDMSSSVKMLQKAKAGSYIVITDHKTQEKLGYSKEADGSWAHRFTASPNTPDSHIATTVRIDAAHRVEHAAPSGSGKDQALFFDADSVVQHADFAEYFLAHHGVKGMKWGVRRPRNPSTGLVARSSSEDQIHVDRIMKKLSKGGTSSLSNKDLQDFTRRLQLEQDFNRAKVTAEAQKGKGFVRSFLASQGKRQFNRVADKALDIAVERALESAGIKVGKKKPSAGQLLEETAGRLKPKKKGK